MSILRQAPIDSGPADFDRVMNPWSADSIPVSAIFANPKSLTPIQS